MEKSVFTTKTGNFILIEETGLVRKLTRTDLPQTERTPLADEVKRQLDEYFEGVRRSFDLPCAPEGTEFQLKVWKALSRIPYGETRTYGEIASSVGNPKACRAVGGAIHRNPILIAIPCHRVIGSDGSLTGFREGLKYKRMLLETEGITL